MIKISKVCVADSLYCDYGRLVKEVETNYRNGYLPNLSLTLFVLLVDDVLLANTDMDPK